MKVFLKLLPIIGLTTLTTLALGCGGADVGDDTPPGEVADEEEEESAMTPEQQKALADGLKNFKAPGGE